MLIKHHQKNPNPTAMMCSATDTDNLGSKGGKRIKKRTISLDSCILSESSPRLEGVTASPSWASLGQTAGEAAKQQKKFIYQWICASEQ